MQVPPPVSRYSRAVRLETCLRGGGSRRHNLEAIAAYGAHERSLGAGEQQPSEVARLKADAISTDAQAVDEWEDEGGAAR